MTWNNYTADQVRTQSKDGVRLALLFNEDFKKKFNRNVCLTCTADFADDFKKYLMATSEKKENPKYLLKKKYDGISLGFGKGRVFNATITEKEAKELAKNHAKGKELFEIFTEAEPKEKKQSVKSTEITE